MATASLYERYRGVDAVRKATRRPTALTAPLMNCGGYALGGGAYPGQAALHRESN